MILKEPISIYGATLELSTSEQYIFSDLTQFLWVSCYLASIDERFWLRVSHEAAVKMSAGLQLPESLTRAGGSTFKMEESLEFSIRKPYSEISSIL